MKFIFAYCLKTSTTIEINKLVNHFKFGSHRKQRNNQIKKQFL